VARLYSATGQAVPLADVFRAADWVEGYTAEFVDKLVQEGFLEMVRLSVKRRGVIPTCRTQNLELKVTVQPAWLSWRGGLAVATARRMYDARDFADMPVLADMLEEAGCRDEPILKHCRGPGPHHRGCVVVGALLAHLHRPWKPT
jgi:hypothetical protein